jgi:hypothetical protein
MANGSSSAGAALSGSIGLIQEVADETDEQRRKRLLAQQQQRLLPGSSPAGAALSQSLSGYGAALSGGY